MKHPNRAASEAGAPPGDASEDRNPRRLVAGDREPPPAAARITVSLVPKAAADLQKVHDRTGMPKTDVINRAVSLYEFIEAEITQGADLVIHRDGQDLHVKFL
jgi:hypothetical protein